MKEQARVGLHMLYLHWTSLTAQFIKWLTPGMDMEVYTMTNNTHTTFWVIEASNHTLFIHNFCFDCYIRRWMRLIMKKEEYTERRRKIAHKLKYIHTTYYLFTLASLHQMLNDNCNTNRKWNSWQSCWHITHHMSNMSPVACQCRALL